jgi:hypothetical protein
MTLHLKSPLPFLKDEELEQLHGAGGELAIALTAPPIRGNVGLTYAGAKGSVTGSVTLDGRAWGVGFTGAYNPSKNLSLEGQVRADGTNYELGLAARIRFFNA